MTIFVRFLWQVYFIGLLGLFGPVGSQREERDNGKDLQVTVRYLGSGFPGVGGMQGAVMSWTSRGIAGTPTRSPVRESDEGRGPRVKIDWLAKNCIKVHWGDLVSLPGQPLSSHSVQGGNSVTNILLPLIVLDTSKVNFKDDALGSQESSGRGKLSLEAVLPRSAQRSLAQAEALNSSEMAEVTGREISHHERPPNCGRLTSGSRLGDRPASNSTAGPRPTHLVHVVWEEPGSLDWVGGAEAGAAKIPPHVALALSRSYPPPRTYVYYPGDLLQDPWSWYPYRYPGK